MGGCSEQIFSDKCDLRIWPQIVSILKRTDEKLNSYRSGYHKTSENFLKRWRHIISILVISYLNKDFNFSTDFLLTIRAENLTDELYDIIWEFVKKYDSEPYASKRKASKVLIYKLIEKSESDLGITNSLTILKRETVLNENKQKTILSPDFVEAVNNLLPEQPWKPGVHLDICRHLKCSPRDANIAILSLIKEGKRFRQKNGVVYDSTGNVLKIDDERVDKLTLLLKK